MAKDKTKKRQRKLRKRAKEFSWRQPGPGGGPGSPESSSWWDERPGGDDPDGGAGVREPRHPRPTMPAAALALDEPRPLYLDLTR